MPECDECIYWEHDVDKPPCSKCGPNYEEFTPNNHNSLGKIMRRVVGEQDVYISQLEFEMLVLKKNHENHVEFAKELLQAYSEIQQELVDIKHQIEECKREIKRRRF